MYHLLVFLLTLASATGEGNFSFIDTHVIVSETLYSQASFRVSRRGQKGDQVYVTCQISNTSAEDDFDGLSQTIGFGPGQDSGSCSFTVLDDNIPERNETFALELILVGSGTVVSPSQALLTILENDDAFGIIGFNETGPVVAAEPSASQEGTRVIRLSRRAGVLGRVQVSWMIASGPNNGADDFTDTNGVVTFEEGQSLANLSIEVKPDNLPENEETFTLALESPTGGAKIDASVDEIIINIPANDAPIEFPVNHILVFENQSTVEIDVYRGLESDGITTIGPVSESATVDWYLEAGSATPGSDYVDNKGTLSFERGQTMRNITVALLNDNVPELGENFTVHLINASQNSIIKPPGIAVVSLRPNDDQHGVISFGQHPQILDEDKERIGNFYVNRSAGTFGSVSVTWKILGNDTDFVFERTSGVLTFSHGESLKFFQVAVRLDSIPEETREFSVHLYNVTGGARLRNMASSQRAAFFVRDSDDVYGVVNFAPDDQQKLNMDVNPRQLHLNITRTMGLLGNIAVNISVTYHLPGSISSSSEVSLTYPREVSIRAGVGSVSVTVEIANDGFIKLGASFRAELTAVSLQSGVSPLTSQVAPSSPRLGDKSTIFLNVTSKDANGEIGFSTFHQTVTVQEPAGPSSTYLNLPVKRSGAADRVIVYWNITSDSPMFFPNDTGPQSGYVVFEEGDDEVNITIEIKADDTPEVAEAFTVNLMNVSGMDKLQVGADKAEVTIAENDNPGGTFEFNSTTAIVLQEVNGANIANVVIVRLGSALDTRLVSFKMTPSGDNDFYGSSATVFFQPGEVEKNYVVIAIDDSLPEIDEVFELRLYSAGLQGQQGVLGDKTVINVTIKENDDAYGVFGFRTANIVKTIGESKSSSQTTSFEVFRDRGTFGTVDVTWNLTANSRADPSLDVTPVEGRVTFSPGDTSKNINISSVPDMIPERDESFTILLNNVSYIAKFGAPSLLKATLIVTKNDDPVYFAQPTQVQVREGQYANLTIKRGGDGSSVIDVWYQTVDGTAVSSNDYQARTGNVTFDVGEFEKEISIWVNDDSSPEGVEKFVVNLTSSSGNTVLYGNTSATVVIFSSDGGTGSFQFASNSVNRTTAESSPVYFTVERKSASFGEVRVYWRVLRVRSNGSTSEIPQGQEFVEVMGFVTFTSGLEPQTIGLTPIEDGIAELDETFELRLINATGIQTGEDGVLSSPSSAFVKITANDDPNGLLKFSVGSVDIPEDFDPGMEASTQKNLTVLRNQGKWGTIKVAWEVQSAKVASIISDNVFDLFLLGSEMHGVKSVPALRRPNTQTYVYCFDGTNESFVETSVLTGVNLKFSVRFWVNATKGKYGYVLASLNGDTVNFALSLNTTGPDTMAKFIYLNNETNIAFGKDIADDEWHFIAFTVDTDSKTFQFYLDDARVGNARPIPSGSVSGDAVYRVGKGQSSESLFTGCIQDITVYPQVLGEDYVMEMAKRNDELSPINGYLIFEPYVSRQQLSIHTVDDDTPEDDTSYLVVLYSPTGGARLHTRSNEFKLTLKVLKSDNANGLFGFESVSAIAVDESSNVTLTIERSMGKFGTATVNWSVYKGSSSVPASSDFTLDNGSVVFSENEEKKVLMIPVNDDMLPEIDEDFMVVLTSVSPMDGSTNTSAASLKPGYTTVNVTIQESDFPNGLLQFMSDIPVGNATVPPSSSQFNVDVRESVGTLTLYVIRAQGTLGKIKCQWQTAAGTARSPQDYTETTGAVEFAAGSRSTSINITIVDNSIAELGKTFTVELFNPEGGAKLNSVAKVAHVTILPSDDAFGVISFAPDSLSRTISEASGSTVSLTVQRREGLLGASTVYWQVSGQAAPDVENTNGSVVLPVNVNRTQISIRIKEDVVPELAESFLVTLTNVSAGRLANDSIQSNVTISASDDPYGVFVFTASQLTVVENNITVNLTILRKSGTRGVVRVNYSSVSQSMANLRMATPNVDFIPISGAVVFSEGQRNATISLDVLDDLMPEAAEAVIVNITNVELLSGHPVFPVPDNSPRVGVSRVAQLTIEKNDNANGIVQLSSSAVSVHEPHFGSIVNVTRTAGDFGTIAISFQVDPLSANGSDYRILSRNITLADQQREARVPIAIIHDLVPEFNENFRIRLTGVYGGAVLGSPQQCVVTIMENDYPYGLIGFNNASLSVSVQEREGSNSRVKLTVVRRFGLRGGSRIHWEARLNGVLATDDITPVQGDLVFAQGVSSRDVEFDVKPDSIPEILEIVEVNLTSVTFLSEGTPSLDEATRVARVRIEASDAPHGVVEFAQASYSASEGNNVYLEVSRHFGTAGDIRVFYSTMDHLGGNRALPGIDYASAINNSIIIPGGRSSANINISIFDDENPELGEVFDVELTHVELIGYSPVLSPQIGGVRKVAVTIVTNDDAHGLMVIRAANPDAGSHGSRVTVDEIESLSVRLIIERLKGAIGSVTVDVAVEQDGATLNSDFVASESTFSFSNNGNTSQSYIVSIQGDDIPEPNEDFLIRLVNPTGGARVASGLGSNVTVTIQANDGAAGQVGFDEQSSSLVVQEGSQVSLFVNRTLAVGRVTVDWLVTGANASSDFVSINGSVEFNEGETHTSIVLTVRNDTTPETHEVFVVHLSNIQTFGIASSGHATLIQEKTTAVITISASDRPHGVVELAGSRLVTRNDEKNFTLTVSRLFGNIGTIRVWYEVSTGNVTVLQSDQSLATAGKDFIEGRRSIIIDDSVDVGSIPVLVIDDDDPELDEVFIVNITRVELVNAAQYNNTVPPLLGSHLVSQITLLANDDPYGVFKFPQARVYLTESSDPYNITVLRSQGTFGKEKVNFFVRQVTVQPSDYNVVNYGGGEGTLTFEDGVSEQNITIFVTNDSRPEGDEILNISLTRNSGKTALGDPKTLEVVIRASDDGYGVFALDQSSLIQTISEPGTGPVTEAEFVIVRTVGSYGTVIVNWEVVNASSSADLTPVKGNVTFVDGDRRMTFKVKALLDSVPEKAETFIIQLEITGNGRLVSPSKAQLTITENDSPYGELQIVSSLSSRSSVDIEESQGIVKAKVSRRKGDFGRITLDYMTISRTATSASGDVAHFEKLQRLKTSDAYSWHTFSAFGDKFVLLASKNRTGDLPADVDDGVMGQYYGSALFRWQGVLVPLQLIATDGGAAWDSFVAGDKVYLAAANQGSVGRYETHSRIYIMDQTGKMTVIQNISTQGASDVKFFQPPGQSDVYLILANQMNNAGQTRIRSQVYKWTTDRFVRYDARVGYTRSASSLAVFTNAGSLKVAIAFFQVSASGSFRTQSPIYRWDGASFSLHQEISTNGPVDVEYFEFAGNQYLVFANSKSTVDVFQWDNSRFNSSPVQSIAISSVQSAKPYTIDGNAYLVTTESSGRLAVFKWDSTNMFTLQMNTTIADIESATPLVINDPVSGLTGLLLAAVSGKGMSPVLRPVSLSPDADFIPRQGQLIFENGQKDLELDFTILTDSTPERDESFSVRIYNASGKAIVDTQKQELSVNILSNDDAHGRIGFEPSSLSRVQAELTDDSSVTFEVIREYGSLGRAVALWNATGNFSQWDISPLSGELVFEDGETSQNITITVHRDTIPELAEVVYIRLQRLTETGSTDPNRGAVLNSARAIAMLVIPANDEPHGVITWKNAVVISQEDGPKNVTLSVYVMRLFGLIGDIVVSFETVQLSSVSNSQGEQIAVAGIDFKAMQRAVEIPAGVNSTRIDLEITHYTDTEITKIFQVNLSSVTLKRTDMATADSPRIDKNTRLMEVVIAQPNQTLGELNFDVSALVDTATQAIMLNEEVGMLNITAQRTESSLGTVGFRFIARPLISSTYSAADDSDFSPSEGTVMFTPGISNQLFHVSITNDDVPEIKEGFYVQISRPIGGVTIGPRSKVDVVIEPNDEPYGRFGFTKAISDGINVVREGAMLSLEVQRQRGSFRDVHVRWEITPNAGIANASSQISPMNGTISFRQGDTSEFMTLHALDDSVAEVGQSFTIQLVAVDNGGIIDSSLDQATIYIPANDKVEGVASIDSSTRHIIAGEPVHGYNGVFVIRILRQVGQSGDASVSWEITSRSGGSTPASTFNATSGRIDLPTGVDKVLLPIQVIDDLTAERLAVYAFRLTSASIVELDPSPNSREASVTVVASDDPFGIIEIQSASPLNVSEDSGFVNLTVLRNGGNIGELKVNYSISSDTATHGMDYRVFGDVLTFADKEDQKTIHVEIMKDDLPELAEIVRVRLVDVKLVSPSPVNFSVVDGLQLNAPPRIRSDKSEVLVVITENDEARGIIRFTQSALLVREDVSTAVLQLRREGGTLGDAEVSYSVRGGTATQGSDFSSSGGGAVLFSDGQNSATINITIIDDRLPEHREIFTVTLDSVTAGAQLGSPVAVVVTIETSDDPMGLFGFVNASDLSLENPSRSTDIGFVIEREGGAEGNIEVKWKVVRLQPSCAACLLSDDFEGQTDGSETFPNGVVGAKRTVRLRIKPFLGHDEPEEQFVLTIYEVSGNGSIDGLRSNITITIAKHGFPNGVFRFQNTATQTFTEPTNVGLSEHFTVVRNQGTQGTVNVNWQITGPPDGVRTTSGSLIFQPSEDQKNIVVVITPDDIPELEKVYSLKIVSVDGGADLDPAHNNVTFKIRANDNPHGIFKLQPGAQKLEVAGNSRKLQFAVLREKGTSGAVDILYEVRHSEWYPVEMKGHVTVPHQQNQARVNISLRAFLRVASSFTVTLTGIRYSDSQVPETSIAPELSTNSASDSSEVVPVPEIAANAVLKFADNSLKLTVEADNTVSSITVVREGLFGSVSVIVAMGFLPGTFPADFSAGQVLISGSPLSFTGSMKNATFSAMVGPMLVPDKKLVYSLYLDRVLTTPADLLGGANITADASRRTAVVEYNGVVVVAPDRQNLIADEGSVVKCTLLRQFSVLGSVTVNYIFLGQSKALSMAQGEFSKEFDIDIADSNDRPEKDRVVFLNLTGVSGSFSPRLGLNKTVRIVVKDNDDPQGVFSFRKPSVSVPEDATSGNTRTVELEIQRTGGTLGNVSVIVRTIGGGEGWSPNLLSLKEAIAGKAGEKNATAGPDYEELEAKVDFANADPIPAEPQVMNVQLKIKDDVIPEPNEVVLVYLTAATGGARVATDSDVGLQSWAAVTIEGNDMMNGRIEFVPGTRIATADEDRGTPAVLRVGRSRSFGQVQVSWNISESAFTGEVEPSQGIITFAPGEDEKDLIIRLKNDNKAERKGRFHVLLTGIKSGNQALIGPANSAVVIVLGSDYPNGTIQFAKDAIFKAVDKSLTEISVEVIRGQGLDTDVIVYYETRDLSERVTTKPGVETHRAVVGQDYQRPTTKYIRFAKQETSKLISISLTPNEASAMPYPKAFEIVLLNATSGATIMPGLNSSMVIISENKGTTTFLRLRALALQTPLTDADIYRILSDLLNNIRNTLNEDQMELARDTITIILQYKNNVTLTERLRTSLMKIFDELLNPSRDHTKGQHKFSVVFEAFAFSLLNGKSCPSPEGASITGTYAVIESFRRRPDQMNGIKFNSSNGKDYFKYPSDLYPTSSSSSDATCRDVHFINYYTAHWFNKPNKRPVISDKVFSTSLRTTTPSNDASSPVSSRNPITYRIYTNNKRVTPKGADCVFWDYSKSAWSKEGCTSKNDNGDYVECQCDHLSVFAAQGESDDRAGYSLPFFIVFLICLGVFAVSVIIHHLCSVVNMFAAKLLMHLFFACMMGQLMFIVNAFVSPQLVNEPIRCSVLAMFFHYFFLCQFTWMFVEAWNLWRTFVLNDEHTDRKFVLFFILGWGLPVVAVVLYILVTQLGFGWAFTVAYADVHNNGDMCFIPNAYAALAGAVGPVLLLLMGVAVVFTQAYQVTLQWKCYDDIFRGHYNIKEIRYVIILFVLLTLVWLFAGLHVTFGYEWMLITFIVLDGILALYVLIWYCCLRNQLRGVFKQTFAVPPVPPPIELREDMFRDRPGSPAHSIGSLKRPMTNTLDDPVYLRKIERRMSAAGYPGITISDWDDLDFGATPKGSRKMLVDLDDTDSLGLVNDMYDDDDENQDFDDLIFALKTGGHYEGDPARDDEKDPDMDSGGFGGDQFGLRRISIADTHL